MAKQARGWCYTLNNYTPEEVAAIDTIEAEYHVVGFEQGDEKEVPHLQGYIYFAGRGKRFGGVKKLPGFARAHLEVAKGTALHNRTYCTKQGTFVEKGTMPQAGARTDLDMVKLVVKQHGTMAAVIEAASGYQCLRAGELLLKYAPAPERPDIRVRWYWGPTGSGKTRAAWDEAKAAGPCWMSSRSLKWWDGYDGEKNVVVDDFRRDFCTFHELLRILDRYPYRVEFKGGSRPLLATNIWITTPRDPRSTFEGRTDEDIGQITRRIAEIREFRGEPLAEPEVQG